MADLTIYRSAVAVTTVKIDEKTILTRKLMNEDKVTSDFVSASVLPIKLGDYIVVSTKKYYLNQLPNIEKQNDKTFKYNVTFQSELYDLYNKLLMSVDGLSDFSYTGTPLAYIELIVNNMNEISTGWTVGTIEIGRAHV